MSDDEAYAVFKEMRFAENGGEPFCPRCGCDAIYTYKVRREFKCKACDHRFTLTSGTLFRGRKMAIKDILVAILLFVNGVNGNAALRLSRDLGCAYKTAFVLLAKLRRAQMAMQIQYQLTGEVDIDGLWIGGYIRQENMVVDRESDGRKQFSGKRRSIVTMRERRPGGRSRAVVVANEKAAVDIIKKVVAQSAHIITDEQPAFSKLHLHFEEHSTVNHSLGLVVGGVHTNPVESQHTRIRRGERGVYLHISGNHAQRFAHEFSWRDDFRRLSNGQQFRKLLGSAATISPDLELAGYWQKRPKSVRDLNRRRALKVRTQKARGAKPKPISYTARATV
nr:IS1595 family transposase [Brevundimonas sp. UBA7534]